MGRSIYILLLTMLVAVACGGAATPGVAAPLPVTPAEIPAATATSPPVVADTPASRPGATPPPSTATPSAQSSPTAPAGETPSPTVVPAGPIVTVGDTSFTVDLALTTAQRAQGLSDRPHMDPGTGMLFIFESEVRLVFWMKDMHFPLDMVWIDGQCTVIDITRNAPPPEPGQTLSDLPRYSPSKPARHVLEINAGEADAIGIKPGDMVQYAGDLAGRFGC